MSDIPVNFSQRIAGEVEKIVAVYFEREDGRRPDLYRIVIGMAEKPLIEAVLAHHGGNQSHAALELGINRNTLRKKIREHGIRAAQQ